MRSGCSQWGGDAEEQLLQSERGGSEHAGGVEECISNVKATGLSGNGLRCGRSTALYHYEKTTKTAKNNTNG